MKPKPMPTIVHIQRSQEAESMVICLRKNRPPRTPAQDKFSVRFDETALAAMILQLDTEV